MGGVYVTCGWWYGPLNKILEYFSSFWLVFILYAADSPLAHISTADMGHSVIYWPLKRQTGRYMWLKSKDRQWQRNNKYLTKNKGKRAAHVWQGFWGNDMQEGSSGEGNKVVHCRWACQDRNKSKSPRASGEQVHNNKEQVWRSGNLAGGRDREAECDK